MKKFLRLPFDVLVNKLYDKITENKKVFKVLLFPFVGKVSENNSGKKSVEEIKFMKDLYKILPFPNKFMFDYMYEKLPQYVYLSIDRKIVEDLKVKLEKIGATVKIVY